MFWKSISYLLSETLYYPVQILWSIIFFHASLVSCLFTFTTFFDSLNKNVYVYGTMLLTAWKPLRRGCILTIGSRALRSVQLLRTLDGFSWHLMCFSYAILTFLFLIRKISNVRKSLNLDFISTESGCLLFLKSFWRFFHENALKKHFWLNAVDFFLF